MMSFLILFHCKSFIFINDLRLYNHLSVRIYDWTNATIIYYHSDILLLIFILYYMYTYFIYHHTHMYTFCPNVRNQMYYHFWIVDLVQSISSIYFYANKVNTKKQNLKHYRHITVFEKCLHNFIFAKTKTDILKMSFFHLGNRVL